jgi:hypothetical protein
LARQSKQRTLRSHAYALLANGARDEEVAAAVTDAVRLDLELALEGILAEERAAGDREIAAAIGAVVGLIGADWARSAREEFIALATAELMALPGALVLDALARARRRVTAGRMLVSWVADDVEPKAERLKIERERLTRLAELAVPAA